jgi:hypothetical protein
MQPGDKVQIKQWDHSILRKGEEPTPTIHWIYADVLQLTPGGALVQVNHPGNIEHGSPKTVARADLRTADDVQKLHDKHPAKDVTKLDFNRADHKELNNLRVALERMQPPEPEAA